ncbi:hypothetical protein SNE40_010581 [Patella caerulea]|uniref:MBD domain-containing protein n=1 Tax=Patella caerulea TaxID=87958 RepID=A0AAN8PRS7_PATCE
MNTGNGQRPNQHVGRVQQQIPNNPNLCQFQYVGMPVHHQGLKSNQFSPTQGRNHGYMGPPQTAPGQQAAGQATFPVASMANMGTPVVAGTFPTADILANFNQMGPPRPNMQYKTMNNWTNPNPPNAMALPSIGSLWSHFQQQQHNKQNIQQPQQHVNQQQVTYLPPPQQQQFISNTDTLTFCGNPNLQYGMNQSSGTLNHALNYGGFVINRIPQASQNPQIVNTCHPNMGISHQGMIPTNLQANAGLLQSTLAPPGMAPPPVINTDSLVTTSLAASSNQVTTPTTTVTLTCSTSAQVTETATVHSRIPVTSVLSPTSSTTATIKPQTVDPSCNKDSNTDTVHGIKIPFGWKRSVENNQVVYYSPSSMKLCNKQEVCNYLLLDGTCKCGLECPLLVDKVFNFDVCVVGQQWNVEDVTCSQDLSKLCNHNRKIIAMARFQHSQSVQTSTGRSASCSSHGDDRDQSDVESNKTDQSSSSEIKPNSSNHITSTQPKVLGNQSFGTALLDAQTLLPPGLMVHNHRMPKFTDVPHINPFEVATKPRPVRKRKPRAKKSQTPDPAADLGPITCHVPQKLDFSQESHFSYRFKMDQMNCHMQPSLSPNDYQQGLVSPQGLLSPQPGLVSPPSVFNAQSQGMKGPVVFQNSAPVCAVPSGQFLEQVPTSAMNTANLQSQFQVPVNIQSNTGVMFQQMMPVHNPVSPRLGNEAMYNPNNPYQQNVLCNTNAGNYAYPQMTDLMWLEAGKPKSKRPRGKKDKHKLNSIVDRTSPCPNVDVRNLGPKTPESNTEVSFLENPTAFLAQQTVLVNNSIKSPLAQSKDLTPPSNAKGCEGTTSGWKSSAKPLATNTSITTAPLVGISPDASTNKPTNLHHNKDYTSTANLKETKPSDSLQRSPVTIKIEKTEDSTETSRNENNPSDLTTSGDKVVRLGQNSNQTEKRSPNTPSAQVSASMNDEVNQSGNNLQQINTEQGDFPASNLLSAAARAQITQQQTQNILGHNINTVTNTVADNANVAEWMNKIVLANNGAANIPLDQHTHIMLQQNPNILAGGQGGLVNTFNGMTGLPLNMFFPLGQAVDPSSLSPSNLLLNVNQQVPFMKSDVSNATSTVLTTSQDPNNQKSSVAHVQASNQVQATEMVNTDQGISSVNTPMPRISVPLVSNVTNSISQVIPTVGVTQPILNQQPLTQMLGGMTFPAMNSLFVTNPIAPNQHCNQNLTLMDIMQPGEQNKAVPKSSPTSVENVAITGNINPDMLAQAQKNDQLGNNANQQLLFLPNLNFPMMQVQGSNPYFQQAEIEKLGLQGTPQYMVPNPIVDPTGQFCANQQNQNNLLGLLGMQQMWNNLSTTAVGNLTPAQLQQVQTLQFQQLLLQQLQGMQTLVNQISLQTVSQQGLDNGTQQTQGLKMEQDCNGADGEEEVAQAEDGEDEPEDTEKPEEEEEEKPLLETKVMEKPHVGVVIKRNTSKSSSKNVNKKINSASTSETNHGWNSMQSDKIKCVPRKKLKQELKHDINHDKTKVDSSNHLHVTSSNFVANSTSENHITSGCVQTETNVKHSSNRPVHHYNGEITLVNTASLKRSRDEDLNNSGGILVKREKLSRNFHHGDLVWGEVAGSDWPGKLIHCNNHINNTDCNGINGEEKVLVKWFGDCGESRVELVHLKSWNEGLLAYQQTQQTKNKRERHFNATLEEAIKEALLQERANNLPLMVRANKKKKV